MRRFSLVDMPKTAVVAAAVDGVPKEQTPNHGPSAGSGSGGHRSVKPTLPGLM